MISGHSTVLNMSLVVKFDFYPPICKIILKIIMALWATKCLRCRETWRNWHIIEGDLGKSHAWCQSSLAHQGGTAHQEINFSWRRYCTISTDRSHLVMRDAHSSLTLMFTTNGDAWLNEFFDQIVHKVGAKRLNFFLYLQSTCNPNFEDVHRSLWCVTKAKLVQFMRPCDAWCERSVEMVQYKLTFVLREVQLLLKGWLGVVPRTIISGPDVDFCHMWSGGKSRCRGSRNDKWCRNIYKKFAGFPLKKAFRHHYCKQQKIGNDAHRYYSFEYVWSEKRTRSSDQTSFAPWNLIHKFGWGVHGQL